MFLIQNIIRSKLDENTQDQTELEQLGKFRWNLGGWTDQIPARRQPTQQLEEDSQRTQKKITFLETNGQAMPRAIHKLLKIWRGSCRKLWMDQRRGSQTISICFSLRPQMGENRPDDAWQVINMIFRSENCLKNKFYGSLRKTIRKVNKVEK